MGARLRLPLLGQGLAAHLRASSSLDLSRGKEVALGLSWRPLRRVAAEIIIEQRLGLDAQGRSDPAILLAAGMNDTPIGSGLIAEGYGQIGMVGHPKLDAFGDGRLTLTSTYAPRRALAGAFGPVRNQMQAASTLAQLCWCPLGIGGRHWTGASVSRGARAPPLAPASL